VLCSVPVRVGVLLPPEQYREELKELSHESTSLSLKSSNSFVVLRIWDVYPGSRILISIHPGSQTPDKKQQIKRRGKKFVLPFF
jgi:hypothetical protein